MSAETPRSGAIADLLESRNPALREALRPLLVSAVAYLLAVFLEALAAARGLVPAPRVWLLAGYSCTGQLVLYTLIRSGISQRLRDPALTMARVFFGIGVIGLTYALLEVLRGATLVLLFLVLAFDMERLKPRQMMVASGGAVAMLAVTLLLMLHFLPQETSLRTEIPNIAMASVLVPALCAISLQVAAMRKQLVREKIELEAAVDKLRHLAEHDGLTGLFNRHYALNRIDQTAASGTLCECCVAILDIDHFKRINDTFGHGIGDAVLRAISALLNQSARDADVLARWGGEEFLMYLPGMNGSQSLSVLQRLRQRASEHDWARIAPQLKVSFSAGVAQCAPRERWMQALLRADEALYRAKRSGRDRIVVA